MTDHSPHVRRATEQAVVRRVPKYSVFMIAGGVVGVIVAAILTFVFNGTIGPRGEDIPSPYSTAVYTKGQVFGFLVLICVPVGLALGGIVALLLGRSAQRHDYVVEVEHETVTEAPAETPEPSPVDEAPHDERGRRHGDADG